MRVIRFLGSAVMAFVAAAAIASAAPASATTASAMSHAYTPPPSPLTVMMTPLNVGVRVIEAIAEGIANAVEFIATPEPIAIPAPHVGT